MTDKYNKHIKMGDWIFVEWYNPRNQPRVGIIKEIRKGWHSAAEEAIAHILEYNEDQTFYFLSEYIERLPDDEQERNEILMLRILEQ